MKLNFQPIPVSTFANQSTTKSNPPKSVLTLEEKITLVINNSKGKTGKWHFKTIIHEGFLVLFNGKGMIITKFDNSNSFKAERMARAYAISLLPRDNELVRGYLFN